MKHKLIFSHVNDFGNGYKHILFNIDDFLYWFSVENSKLVYVKAEDEGDNIEHYNEDDVREVSDEEWAQAKKVADEINASLQDYEEYVLLFQNQ